MHQPANTHDPILETALELLESQNSDFWMLVKGMSMLPIIREGDRILVQPLKSPPVRGDILALHQANGLVAHRLLRLSYDSVGEGSYLTQGDHALMPDPPVTIDQILGRAVTLQHGSKILRLDEPGWMRIGRAVCIFQLAAAWAGRNMRLRRAITACLDIGLRAYLALVGQ
jgi:signal peptidase I